MYWELWEGRDLFLSKQYCYKLLHLPKVGLHWFCTFHVFRRYMQVIFSSYSFAIAIIYPNSIKDYFLISWRAKFWINFQVRFTYPEPFERIFCKSSYILLSTLKMLYWFHLWLTFLCGFILLSIFTTNFSLLSIYSLSFMNSRPFIEQFFIYLSMFLAILPIDVSFIFSILNFF
jgi:hypothetical protein